jgi:hypothetical protein
MHKLLFVTNVLALSKTDSPLTEIIKKSYDLNHNLNILSELRANLQINQKYRRSKLLKIILK